MTRALDRDESLDGISGIALDGDPAGLRRAALAAAGLAGVAVLEGCSPPGPFTPGDPYPDVVPPALPDALRKLVNRATFGMNAREAELAQDLGYAGYVDYHLAYDAIDDTALDNRLGTLHTLNWTPVQRIRSSQRDNAVSVDQFALATLLRSAYSTRQLYERMVEVWTNHFNIFIQDDHQRALKPVDDAEVIRPHALGNFYDLLWASAHSPAMLVYLDNDTSVAGAPNENYARELLELHTLGAGNFTQQDVEEVARCFTGWTVVKDTNAREAGRFYFDPEAHDMGSKVVLGQEIPAGGGESDGEAVLSILTSDPAVAPTTARFLAGKLAVLFYGYEPPAPYVQEIADAYSATGGDLRAMVRAALAESWIAQAPPKLKRPYHFIMSSLRARPSNINNGQRLASFLLNAGHFPYFWPAPDGYPDDLDHWGSRALERWNFGARLPCASRRSLSQRMTSWFSA